MNPLKRIRSNKRSLRSEDLIDMHHELMCVYGWIPLEEFKALPLPTAVNLWNKCRVEMRRRHDSQFAAVQAISKKKLNREKW